MLPMKKYDYWDDGTVRSAPLDVRSLSGHETRFVSSPYPLSVGAFTHQPTTEWLRAAREKITELCSLSRGWDGYRGVPVDQTTANYAIQVMSSVVTNATPLASVLPMSGGGLQFEWHREGRDLEVTFYSPMQVEVSFSDEVGGDIDFILSDDVGDLKLYVEEIAR